MDRISNSLTERLQKSTVKTLVYVEKAFIFITEITSYMPAIPGASVPLKRIPSSQRWVCCLGYLLNTGMKFCNRLRIKSGS